jgi:hypothetical protein
MTDDQMEIVRRLSDLPDDRKERLFELLAMPDRDYQVIVGLPRKAAFWLGVAATLGVIGTAIWALVSIAPDRAADAANAALKSHGP